MTQPNNYNLRYVPWRKRFVNINNNNYYYYPMQYPHAFNSHRKSGPGALQAGIGNFMRFSHTV